MADETVQRTYTRQTAHRGVEQLACAIAVAGGIVRAPEDFYAARAELQSGCRELALMYMRSLAGVCPPGIPGMDTWLDPTYEDLYPADDDGAD